jgi:hypothetical protein
MVYVIWSHAFNLPGATTNQYSFETFADKKTLVTTIREWFEESREPIINLGTDDAEESLDEVLEELRSLLEDPTLESMDLTDRDWMVEDAEIVIHMAEEYPAVLGRFQDVALEVAEDVFSEYLDEEEEEDVEEEEDDEDDEYLRLYRDIRSVNPSTTQEEFDRIFEACDDLGEWSVF